MTPLTSRDVSKQRKAPPSCEYRPPTPGRALVMSSTVATVPGFGLKDGSVLSGTPLSIGPTEIRFLRHDGVEIRRPHDQMKVQAGQWQIEALAARANPFGGHTSPETGQYHAAPGWEWLTWTIADHIAFDEEPRIHRPPLVIVACGSRKSADRRRADELYTGSYTQLALRAARSIVGADRIRIASAGHGLLDLHEQVDPYNTRLGDPSAITAAEVRAQAKIRCIHDVEHVVVLAGRDYADLARAVWPRAYSPLVGTRGIGDQQRILARIAAGEDWRLVS
jgi:hypothetical protein